MLARHNLSTGLLTLGLSILSFPVLSESLTSCGEYSLSSSNGSSKPEDRKADRRPQVRRLGDFKTDQEEWTFSLPGDSDRPQPRIESIETFRDGGQFRLSVSVLNDSWIESPSGGITLSFPALSDPDDRELVEFVEAPEDMVVHVIAAGQPVFKRDERISAASNLMIEVQGSWRPQQRRKVQVAMKAREAPTLVQYRSALADGRGRYYNTPQAGEHLDQQGWPVRVCLANPGLQLFSSTVSPR